MPDGAGFLVTERPGRLRHITRDGAVSAPIAGVPEVFDVSQGGLLDVALAPDFAQSRVIYLSFAKPLGLMRAATAVIRATLSRTTPALTDITEIFEQSPPPAFRSISAAASCPPRWLRLDHHRRARRHAGPEGAGAGRPPPTARSSGSRRGRAGPGVPFAEGRARARTRDAGPTQYPGRGPCPIVRRSLDGRTRARRRR
jgi:hypothetical protein